MPKEKTKKSSAKKMQLERTHLKRSRKDGFLLTVSI